MQVAEDAFGSDREALCSIPLSLATAEPEAVLPTLSIVGSRTEATGGVEPGLALFSAVAEFSEEGPLSGGGAVSAPPKGRFMEDV